MSNRTVTHRVELVLATVTIGITAALITNAEDAASAGGKSPVATAAKPPSNPLNAQRAFGYLKDMCAFGPRPSGSAAMLKQQAYLKEHFEKLGGKVTFQRFLANNPLGGEKVPMANIIIEWHPE